MSKNTMRPAKVERPIKKTYVGEIIATIFVLGGLWMLFVYIGPEPAKTVEPAQEKQMLTDFRDLSALPVRTVRRSGHISRHASAETVLEVLGASPDAARTAAAAISATQLVNVKKLPDSTEIVAHFEALPEGSGDLVSVSLRANAQQAIFVGRRADGSFLPSVLSARKANGYRRIAATISTNFEEAVIAGGGLQRHAAAVVNLFPDDTALKTGGRPGERFDIVYEVVEDERGNVLAYGDLVFAAFNGEASKGSWYRYTPSDTRRTEFYNRQGQTRLPLLSRYPVGFVPITSGFGPRYHPLSGERRHHGGVDFYAWYGTKIYAAGDGIIERADWANGYGRQVRITHARGITTLYAHMSAFAEGIKPGVEVRKGDLIGYVGASGAATGPHLHYEVRKDGKQVNPALLKLPSGRRLEKHPVELAVFRNQMKEIDTFRGAVTTKTASTLALGVRPAF